MTTVERFDVNAQPDAGRPRVVEFRERTRGRLSLHVSRDDGALWLFAVGPRGGEAGRLAFGLPRADDVLAWVDEPGELLSASGCALTIRTGRLIVVRGVSRFWRLPLDAAARDELLTALREWARAAKRVPA